MLAIKKDNDVNNKYINELAKFSQAGVYCLFSPKNNSTESNFTRYGKNINELVKIARSGRNSNRNWYLSFNTLNQWHRSENNVLGLNGLFIDVDCNRNGIDKGRFYYHLVVLNDILDIAKLPEPNVIVDSGHGFYLKWYFKNQVIVHNQCINRLWNKLERVIVKQFNVACNRIFSVKLGDMKATDSSRVLRITNTWNVKQKPIKCELRSYHSNNRYDMFRYWVKDYLPKIHYRNAKKSKIKRFKRFKRNVSIKITKNKFTLNGYRVNDLNKWLRLRNFNIVGHREEFLFIYACHAIYCEPVTAVTSDINHLNDKFVKPLPESEIMNLVIEMAHVNIKNYSFKNETIINKLGMTIKEQRHMKTLIGSAVSNQRYQKRLLKRKNKRNHNRLIRNNKKLIRDIKIIKLHKKGLSIRRIAKITKCSIGTISSTINRCSKSRSLYSVIENDLKPVKHLQTRNIYKSSSELDKNVNHHNVSREYVDKVIRSPS